MSGHSKWSNIKRRKGAVDAQRGAIFTKLGKEIQVAVRSGGPDPVSNTRLKDIIAKAKQANMPNDNIKRSIAKAAGSGAKDDFEEITYEGYGPSGVSIMVKCLTDNRNRSAADVRHLYNKFGGNMGTSGCVAFMFQTKGTLVIAKEDYPDEEKLMLLALEAGASDFSSEEEVYVISTEEADYKQVRDTLEENHYEFLESHLGPVADNQIVITDEEVAAQLEKMIEALEDHDDVTAVYHNFEYAN